MQIMKVLFDCCFPKEQDPENIQNRQENNSVERSQEKSKYLFIPEENSIIAAPSPHMDEQSCCPKLQLRVLESASIPQGTLITISHFGLEGSKRGKMDGKSYFGSKYQEGTEVLNDFIIDEANNGFGGRHFVIKYSALRQKYLISDLGDGSGTFVKIESSIVLKDGYIISYGNSHMTIHLNTDMELTLKFLEGPKSNEVYIFSPADKTIQIGRMIDCKIRFDDCSMSRCQCTINYDDTCGWILVDGTTEKNSTNGTWLFVESDYELLNGMLIKAGRTLFEVLIM